MQKFLISIFLFSALLGIGLTPNLQATPAPEAQIEILAKDLSIELRRKVTTRKADAGDQFEGELVADLYHKGDLVAPVGTPIRGEVLFARKGQKEPQTHRATMHLKLTEIKLHGQWVPVKSKVLELNGRHKTGAIKVGGGIALGAWLGGIRGAAKGGLLGLGYAALTRDKHIVLRKGTQLDFRVQQVKKLKRAARRACDC